ncbi:hypothetical protein CDLVIII_1893 [Clostridium sp. DL-VIII]|uniref:hypothetical protein n=1 Tax=Clostridium sp. DL-VIII TaxID=641107 RepID=UPI00023B00AA|nr:hypothetical protein [Clostridium sp. DL-VIII]EHI98579.1 hypothetical protein CDLVIII_1893 [Clostridium sp. DL-VIII]
MQTKKLTIYTYNINIGSKIMKRFNSSKGTNLLIILFVFLFLALSFEFIFNSYKIFNSASNRETYVANFKSDINSLSETAAMIESERELNDSSKISSFGSDGEVLSINELKPDLKSALTKIADINNDGTLSNEEISDLKIMKLKPNVYEHELKEFQFPLRSSDCNLKNYVIITEGKYAGTILYNGPLKFIDNDNIRYFGLELHN